MFGNILRVVIVYIIVLIAIRLMGKRQIGQMQPFELVITLIIADLATIPMADRTTPLLHGVVPVLTLLLIHTALSFLTRKFIFMRKVVSGTPVVLISPNGIEYQNLKQLNMNMNDLQEVVRTGNCQSLSEIQYAILETNGNVSIIKKAQSSPVTLEDIKLEKEENELAVILVSDFKLMEENIYAFGLEEKDVYKIIKKMGKNKYTLGDIAYLSFDANGNVYMQPLGAKPISGKYKYKGSLQL